jgi:hypothetical protein
LLIYIVVIGIAAAIGIKELPSLIRGGMKGEAATVVLFLIAGSVMSVIAAKLISVPSPLDMIIWIYTPFNHLLEIIFT